MKLVVVFICATLITALVYAKDLDTEAKREKARRQALAQRGRHNSASFTNEDLERYRVSAPETVSAPVRRAPPPARERDQVKERAFWEREKERRERELARLEASIRRLEWRLKDKKARKQAGERLAQDPALDVLKESIESLRAERKRIEDEFRERARKAGALPGWIR